MKLTAENAELKAHQSYLRDTIRSLEQDRNGLLRERDELKVKLEQAKAAIRKGEDRLNVVRSHIPQTFGEAIQLWPWLTCESHEWTNRRTEENVGYLIGAFAAKLEQAEALRARADGFREETCAKLRQANDRVSALAGLYEEIETRTERAEAKCVLQEKELVAMRLDLAASNKKRDDAEACCAEMRQTVEANHKNHMDYDYRGEYHGSELYVTNDHALSTACGKAFFSKCPKCGYEHDKV